MFDILRIGGDNPITLLRTSKILVIGHDPSTRRRRGIHLFKSSPGSTRCGGGRDELGEGGKYRLDNGIEKQLVLSEPKNMIWIWGGGSDIE